MTESPTDVHPLQLTSAEVAALSPAQRVQRVRDLIERAEGIERLALAAHFDDQHTVAGRVVLFSGGDDSTTLAHLLRHRVDAAAHANTTMGIEATRQYVRDVCASWGLPLIEKLPPADYASFVRARGFPGPAQHFKMYQRLKERCLRQIRAEFVVNPRQQRVIFYAGRRRDESLRRADVPLHERDGSTVWISPLAEWTKLDLNTYRVLHPDCPRNPVSATLHMSGECLCGSFAKADELAQIAEFYPATAQVILDLEAEIADRDDIPWRAKTWGWGALRNRDQPEIAAARAGLGPLCSACAR